MLSSTETAIELDIMSTQGRYLKLGDHRPGLVVFIVSLLGAALQKNLSLRLRPGKLSLAIRVVP